MANRFSVREEGVLTTPSGIEVGIQSLLGEHQALITNQSEKKRMQGFEDLLYDCITFIGNKDQKEMTKKDISRLLEPDRKAILFELRHISNGYDKNFIFDYEFPSEEGKKFRERKVVDFTQENFPIEPFFWVKDQMIQDYKNKYDLDRDLHDHEMEDLLQQDFPVMYQSYDEIIENYFYQQFTLPKCGIKVTWNLLTAEEARKFQQATTRENINSHTMIKMHSPTYVNEELTEMKGKEIVEAVPLDKLVLKDIEALREDIMNKEGKVDSTIVVQYRDDSRKQQQLDLVSMPAFFFPSLAI